METNCMSLEPRLYAAEMENERLKCENEKLKYLLAGFNKPKGLVIPGEDIDEISTKILPKLSIPLTLAAECLVKNVDGITWSVLARNIVGSKIHLGYYVDEMGLINSGDVLGAVAALHKRAMYELADYYLRRGK